ncbi:hypothetical protein QR680_004006 [Steinernema hermaphroditum]|uniref:Lipase n=1 Tax=Steinernema hermaphroditum TaxID=289476 RepID=A0AA39LSJ0_9BILA|nr:hypothetical protein QR680_004006 [Steinernema hermaphroditum]
MAAVISMLCLMILVAVATAYNDPEVTMDTIQIIRYWGYPDETVFVNTEDGYAIELHRIPHGRNARRGEKRPVIFLQHGLECDSSNWVVNLPHQSAAFLFADAGFDVWMGNLRGNRYGKTHKYIPSDDKAFWDFSIDEHIKYDLPSMIDMVLYRTGQDHLYYVGHSQGTLTMFAKLSEDPSFSRKIKKFFALAPVVTVSSIKGIVRSLIDAPLLVDALKVMPHGEFTLPYMVRKIAKKVCEDSIGRHMCSHAMFAIAGPDSSQLNRTRTPVYVAHTPSGTSLKNVLHWIQMVKSGRFGKYDYGYDENYKRYRTSDTLFYDISNIKVDMYLYWSDKDWLADTTDIIEGILPNGRRVERRKLNPQYLKESNRLDDFNHMDFIWGSRAADVIYKPIIETINDDIKNSNRVSGRKW